MAKKVNNWLMFIICFFLGWLGIDKLVWGGKNAVGVFLCKFLLNFLIIGELWNIFDMIMCVLDRYTLVPFQK